MLHAQLVSEHRQSLSSSLGNSHLLCLAEMTELFSELEVAVLDEIQMIGDLDRGWAWTRVLLGADVRTVALSSKGLLCHMKRRWLPPRVGQRIALVR